MTGIENPSDPVVWRLARIIKEIQEHPEWTLREANRYAIVEVLKPIEPLSKTCG